MASIRRIVMESYPVLLACAFVGFFAGYALNMHMEKIKITPLILMMVPPLNGLGGNLGCILGARLASALHLGTVKPQFKQQEVLMENLKGSMLSGAGAFMFLTAAFLLVALGIGAPVAESIKLAFSLLLAWLVVPVSYTHLTLPTTERV